MSAESNKRKRDTKKGALNSTKVATLKKKSLTQPQKPAKPATKVQTHKKPLTQPQKQSKNKKQKIHNVIDSNALDTPLFPEGVPDLKKNDIKALEKPLVSKGVPSLKKNDTSAKPQEDLKKQTEFQHSMEAKLQSSQFRYINEQLYTLSGGAAKDLFEKNPELPVIYHLGYRRQVSQWPLNPLDVIIQKIKQMDSKLVVADFGCGEAKLAASVPNKVHSFDLHAANERVTVCEMSHVPLPDKSVNIVVFCLSLMGTNIKDYISEANRVLVVGGKLLIAEVKSRMENFRDFVEFLVEAGFVYEKSNKRDKMFVWFEFHKGSRGFYSSKERTRPLLKPCKYKKR